MKKYALTFIAISLVFMLAVVSIYYLKKTEVIPISNINNTERDALLEQADLLFKGYYYDEAIDLLNSNPLLINSETQELENKIRLEKDNLVLYTGPVQHIFFHSLILYPEYLFPDLTVPTGGYNEGFSFKSELERLLPQLHERGYVLYSIKDLFQKDENGNMKQQPIYLPAGKKPLILSIDDPTYHYGVGFANRMLLDENGNLATEVITPNNEKIITYDGDVELVVDAFVEKHPDFSFRGNKGVVAATGFIGIFGYDLKTEESVNNAKEVVNKLKENGWLFASHSYTHNSTNFFGPNSKVANIEYDTNKWRATMEPIVGPTNIFIAPFGYTLTGEGLDVILNNGFDIYCNVDSRQPTRLYSTHALMGRIEIGGYALVRFTDILNNLFFNVDSVKDSHRPPISR